MGDVHAIAKDINVEVKVQGEKLQVIDGEVGAAEENMKLGNEQLD